VSDDISDDEARKLLHDRDKQRAEEALRLASSLGPESPCPICGGKLEAGPLHPVLGPVRAAPALECKACQLQAPLRLNRAGAAAAKVVATVIGLIGLQTVLDAQQLTDGRERLTRFAIGGAMLCGGFALASHGAGQVRAVAHAIAIGRRRREEREPKPPAVSWLTENLREVVFAAVLYLILRHFVVEAFVIPTGSMAPTLYGNNFRVACARCDYPFAVGRSDGERASSDDTDIAVCPVCGHSFEFSKGQTSDGSKILVNKLLYKLRRPERYEIVVFKYPKNQGESFIKRVVGLPGETIQIRRGDLYVNGALATKPDEVQDTVWQPYFDARYPWDGLGREWAARATPAAACEVAEDGTSITLRPAAGATATASYRGHDHDSGAGVLDMTSYNRTGMARVWGSSPVGDLRVSASVTPAAGATVRLIVVEALEEERERTVVASFPAAGAASAEFTLEVDGRVVARSTARGPLPAGQETDVRLAYADDRARLIVDGETLLAYDDAEAPRAIEGATARLAASDAEARFEEVRVDRDIYYTHNGGFAPLSEPLTLPDDCYFMMGDNSINSADSRAWGFVREGHLQGRAFLVWWPLLRPFDARLVR
jgi:signal peptidase I